MTREWKEYSCDQTSDNNKGSYIEMIKYYGAARSKKLVICGIQAHGSPVLPSATKGDSSSVWSVT